LQHKKVLRASKIQFYFTTKNRENPNPEAALKEGLLGGIITVIVTILGQFE